VSDARGAESPRFLKDQRDLEATQVALEECLSEHLDAAVEIRNLETPAGAGVSNETFLFQASWRKDGVPVEEEFVLRLHPSADYQVYLEPNFRAQYDLMHTLRQVSDVRVPRVEWFEASSARFGRPFFVMERVHGRVPVSMPLYNREGFLFDATPEQRRRAWESAVGQLAEIHSVPVSNVGFLDRPKWGATPLEQELNYWERAAIWGLEDRYPAQLNTMIAWLRANKPAQQEQGLSWGDARLGNMIFGDDFDVAAVIDWEQAALIGPTADLAWWLFFDEMYSVGQGIRLLEGMGDREDTLNLWASLSGREPSNLDWHEVFVGYKMANLAIRTTVVLPSARGAAPAVALAVLNGALARLGLDPLETL
jgi:aminoglycoside phosphotransferase (APT) family kinase protein